MNRLAPLLLALPCAAALLAPPPARAGDFLGKPLPKWVGELNHKDPEVRRAAAFALSKFADRPEQVIEPLLRRLVSDGDAGVRDMAASALGDVIQPLKDGRAYWGDAEPLLRRALEKKDEARVRRSVIYAVGCFGPDGAALLEPVKAGLSDPDAAVRQNAAWALGRMGKAAAEAVPDLVAALEDGEALVRRDAATALGELGLPAAKGAVKPLIRLVETETDEVVRKTALEKLVSLVGEADRGSAAKVEPLLRDEDPETVRLAAFVLAKMGGAEAKPALPVLRDALKDKDPEAQSLAAAALASIGPDAASAVRDLARVLRESTDTVTRRNCAVALSRIGPEASAAVPALVAALLGDNPAEVRLYSAEALAKMSYPANEKALPDVLKAVQKDTDSSTRQRCLWCLFNVPDLEKVDAVKVLVKILDETDDKQLMVRYDAARILAVRLGADAPEKAALTLVHMMKNKKLLVFKGTDANVSGGSEASSGTSDVRANLGGDARYMAAEALAQMGKTAANNREVMAALREAAQDPDAMLRVKAQEAVKKLGG